MLRRYSVRWRRRSSTPPRSREWQEARRRRQGRKSGAAKAAAAVVVVIAAVVADCLERVDSSSSYAGPPGLSEKVPAHQYTVGCFDAGESSRVTCNLLLPNRFGPGSACNQACHRARVSLAPWGYDMSAAT